MPRSGFHPDRSLDPLAAEMEGPPAVQPPGNVNKLYHTKNMRSNFEVVQHNRILAALVAGCTAGIMGITGIKGFGFYLGVQALMGVALLAKARFDAKRYFPGVGAVLTQGVASQTELLTFLLFWTLGHNLVHLF